MNYNMEYNKKIEYLNRAIKNAEEGLEKLKKKYQLALEEYNKIKDAPDIKISKKIISESKVKNAEASVSRKENILERFKEQLSFARPGTKEDEEYRLRQYNEFDKEVERIVPADMHLCFHGCPIESAMHILEDGTIASSVDRVGYETSYNASGQISVTTKENVGISVRDYTHLLDMSSPAGCIFVLTPKDRDEIESSKSLMIGNVDFKENPERLYSIITTPENIERVSEWAEKSGVDLSKVIDFDGFIKHVEQERDAKLRQSIITAYEHVNRIQEKNKNKDQEKEQNQEQDNTVIENSREEGDIGE